jgi:hypothetical protein
VRTFWERSNGFYSRQAAAHAADVNAPTKDLSTPRTHPLSAAFALALLYPASGLAFPLEQFKGIVNTKPTVEQFEFRVKGKKSTIAGVNENTYRAFDLKYQSETGFRLIEDRHGYDNYRVRFFAGRYQDNYWHLLNSNDVITTVSSGFSMPLHEVSGPAGVATRALGLALDALNLGIVDLGNNGVHWQGLRFNCHSNLIGATIDGELALDAEGQPTGVLMKYTYGGGLYLYRVSYEFNRNRALPVFFPSRIKVEFVGDQNPTLLSDYEIITASFSQRELTFDELDYANWLGTNSKRFVFTNATMYAEDNLKGNKVLRLVRNAPYQSGEKGRRVTLLLLFSSISIAFLLYAVCLTQLRRRKVTQHQKE